MGLVRWSRVGDISDAINDAIVAGGGPGLAAAETLAKRGHSVLVLEQNHEIGSPIRTSGGSFIQELDALGIPSHLYHPISRVRFLAPNNSAVFDYVKPVLCVIDVRSVFQFLAERAISAGARSAWPPPPLLRYSRAALLSESAHAMLRYPAA